MNYCSNKAHRSMIPWHGHQIEGTIYVSSEIHKADMNYCSNKAHRSMIPWHGHHIEGTICLIRKTQADMNYCSNNAHRSTIPWHGHQIEGTICLIRMTHGWDELLQQQGTSLYDSLAWTPDRRDHMSHPKDTRLIWITAATRHIALWFLGMDTR